MSGSRVAGLVALAVLLSAACLLLGLWQYQRTQDILDAERASMSAPIDVRAAATVEDLPAGSVGRPVIVTGNYVAGQQLLVPNRAYADPASNEAPQAGLWVVTALRTGDVIVPVLRGWVPDRQSPAVTVPTEPVQVMGVLQPFDGFYEGGSSSAPDEIASMARPAIERAWSTTTLSAVVVLKSQQPSIEPAPLPVPPTVRTGDVPFPLQNAAYTVQWFVFAIVVWVAFALWVRSERRTADATDSLSA